MNKKIDATLELYRQLCAEIRYYYERGKTTVYLAVIITLAIFGTYFKMKSDSVVGIEIVLLISSFVMGILWLNELARGIALYRTSAYIEIFIDDEFEFKNHKLASLGWRAFQNVLSNLTIPILYISHIFLMVREKIYVCIGIGFWISLIFFGILVVLSVITLCVRCKIKKWYCEKKENKQSGDNNDSQAD